MRAIPNYEEKRRAALCQRGSIVGGDETTHSAKPESGPSRANERDSFSHLLQTGVADRR